MKAHRTTATEEKEQLTDLYRELVLDHAQSPRNFRRSDGATHAADGINPLCGDKLHLYVTLDESMHVRDISFEGSGCAISIASASLMTTAVRDLSITDALACADTVAGRLTGQDVSEKSPTSRQLAKIRALDGVRQYPSRVKCATLPWRALQAALNRSASPATTE